jgi:Kdo2-lipid IVA lauroyltransferase/acyltransferase
MLLLWWFAVTLFWLMPWRAVIVVGKGLGFAFRLLDSKRTAITASNLTHAFPELQPKHIQQLTHTCYSNIGIVSAELVKLATATSKAIQNRIVISGLEPIADRARHGKASILVSGHCANWELLAIAAATQANCVFHIVVHPQHQRVLNAKLDMIRTRFGNVLIPMGSAARSMIHVVNNGGIVAFLVDQYAHGDANPTTMFFGRPTKTYDAPAALAVRYSLPIYTGFAARTDDGKYTCSVSRLLVEEHNTTNVRAITQQHVTTLEQHVRRFPEQWSWQHRRWR